MWLFNSSIGKKFVMALSGCVLVLFVTFHVLMNAVAICWPTAYNTVCHFLGANWYALIASAALGAIVVLHIIYALVLTIQNRKARGNDRYAVNAMPKSVEWSSQNMLVLGIVVVCFLGVHLVQFWSRMQLQEILGTTYTVGSGEEAATIYPTAGTLFLQIAFQQWWTVAVYLIGFIALWFHLNHGFWSMWQSIGWDNDTWLPRLKCIGSWWVSIVIGLFIVQVGVFTWRAQNDYYIDNPELQAQYQELAQAHAEELLAPLQAEYADLQKQFEELHNAGAGVDMIQSMQKQQELNQRAQEIQQEAQVIMMAAQKSVSNLSSIGVKAKAAPASQTNE